MPDDVSPKDRWLTERYADFYRRNPIPLPDRFGRREFGFLFHGQKFFLRHVGFPRAQEVQDFMVRNGPAHSYYSTAYYTTPSARTMAEKGWLGAELIFDLDADHVPGAEKLPYRQQLEKVKFHFLRLVEEFVIDDFGFREKDLLLTFSGGRGYHCHVMHEKALKMSSQERREIVDFVTATGLEIGTFLRQKTVDMRGSGKFARPVKAWKLVPAAYGGWGTRLNRGWTEYLDHLKSLTPAQLTDEFSSMPGIGEKGLVELHDALNRLDDRRAKQLERDRDLEQEGWVEFKGIAQKLVASVVAAQAVPLTEREKGETDEPVTADTKRLIRLPGSLHGKSGLKVVPLRLDQIRDFDPLTEAVAFSLDPVRIKTEKPAKVDVAGVQLDLAPGEHTVPEAAAVMLVARGAAVPL